MTGRYRRGRRWTLAAATVAAVAALVAVSPYTWAGAGSEQLNPASSLGNAAFVGRMPAATGGAPKAAARQAGGQAAIAATAGG